MYSDSALPSFQFKLYAVRSDQQRDLFARAVHAFDQDAFDIGGF